MNDSKIIHEKEMKLIKEIENEKSFSFRKLIKIFELNALLHS